jgi:hypothetical protein
MDAALDALREEVVQNVANVLWGVASEQSGSSKHILILQAERRRNEGLKPGRAKALDEAERCAAPRKERREQNIGIG